MRDFVVKFTVSFLCQIHKFQSDLNCEVHGIYKKLGHNKHEARATKSKSNL